MATTAAKLFLPAPAVGLFEALRSSARASADLSDSSQPASSSRSATATSGEQLRNDLLCASYAIAAVNLAAYLITHALPLLPRAALELGHGAARAVGAPGAGFGWWQPLTASFMHPSAEALAMTCFFACVFGRVLERQHGAAATWATYIVSGAAASLVALWMLPTKAGLSTCAGPAAALGLFMVAILLPRLVNKPLEVACLAPFTFMATTARYANLGPVLAEKGVQIGQLVHVAGAMLAACCCAGVLFAVQRVRAHLAAKAAEERRAADAARQEAAMQQVISIAGQAAKTIGKKLL